MCIWLKQLLRYVSYSLALTPGIAVPQLTCDNEFRGGGKRTQKNYIFENSRRFVTLVSHIKNTTIVSVGNHPVCDYKFIAKNTCIRKYQWYHHTKGREYSDVLALFLVSDEVNWYLTLPWQHGLEWIGVLTVTLATQSLWLSRLLRQLPADWFD